MSIYLYCCVNYGFNVTMKTKRNGGIVDFTNCACHCRMNSNKGVSLEKKKK